MNLSWNTITDIEVLGKVKFDKLQILDLSSNADISNIDILEKFDFIELTKLDLSYNFISDIKILKKVKFNKLEILIIR